MGKSIKASTSNISCKKGILKKIVKSNKKSEVINTLRKKPDIIESYLRTLSKDFGSTASSTANSKRKHDEDPDEETSTAKRPKLVEECTSQPQENFQISNTITDIKFEYILTHLDKEDELKDLFHIDETKINNEDTYYVDWLHELCDEISLEGLDGITIEALWSRMKSNSKHPVLLEGKEDILWNLLKYIDKIEFYILEHPRGNLMIYNKNSFVCPDSGMVLEPMIDYAEIYPYVMVNKDGIRGSCSTYHSRMENSEIIRKLELKEALNIYGNRLIVVASQKMRENAIICETADPRVELGDNEYGLLERVGRARGFGELTQGKVSVLSMIKDSRSVFHLRKTLERKKLLKNQFFILKNGDSGQNKTGKLLHLPRFYRLQKNKTLLLIEEIVEFLRQKPGFSLDFGEFRRYFPRSTGVNKIMKIPEFNKYIKTDIFRPYRYLYPNATVGEWKYKNRNKEKILRIFQLIDPTINVAATWNNADNEDNLDDELGDDEGRGHKCFDSEFLREVFSSIFKEGKEGITLQELVKKVNLDYYTIRIGLRKLQAKNVIDTFRTECGKQRHIYYFARCFHSRKIPMPVSQRTKIPENMLQKIFRNKKTSENKGITNNSSIIIGFERLKRYSSPHFPLHCSAFFAGKETAVSERIHKELSTNNWKSWTFQTKFPNLCDIRIIPKFCKITFEPRQKVWSFIQPINIVSRYSDGDKTMMLILLKSVVMGIKIDIQSVLAGNCNESHQMQDITLDFERLTSANKSLSTYGSNKDFLLGPQPVILSHGKTSENIEITITQSTLPKAYITEYTTYASFDKNATALSLTRTNMILDEINKNSIICDIYKLQRIITDLEKEIPDKKEGQGRIDKNTLHRILLRLVNEGYIKIFKYFFISTEKYKAQWIVAHPTIEITHPLLISSQEQMVVRFFLGMDKTNMTNTLLEKPPDKKPSTSSPFDSEQATSSLQALKEMSDTKLAISYKSSRIFGRILGYQPKFVRMQLFHELLYYLIYDYKQLEEMSRNDIKQVYQYYNKDEFREIPPIYRNKIDWKMFIPPLPIHKNYGNGWTLLSDVILSIPLSIWVKIFHISLECPKLCAYLEHPVRQHYLIKDIPTEFRCVLMHRRKYMFNAVELVYRLCFIGLAQMGPQSTVVKDQIFLYLNRKASLLDTSTSGPSYHKITTKDYEKLSFHFTSREEVDNYWCELWTISMNTPLGQRRIMDGKSVTIETSTFKTMLLDTLKSKSVSEALANDYGHIPGDQQGAGGLDSSMWFHIKRNWLWSSKAPKKGSNAEKENQNVRNANIACIKPVPIRYKELISQSRKVYIKTEQNRTKYIQMDTGQKVKSKAKVVHRNIGAKKITTKLRKEEMDAKDKSILKKVGKIFRSKFSPNEDRILYICRAANYFLSKNMKVLRTSRFLIRDILHILCPESHDKTSAACGRRLTKLERSDLSMKRLKERTHELINVKDLSVHFSPIIFNLNRTNLYSPYNTTQKCVAFIHAVWYIYHNFDVVEKILQGQTKNIDFFSPTNIDTLSTLLVNIDTKKSVFSPPKNDEDVAREAIKSVLMSALNCSKLGHNISYQFYQICRKYSDQTIRAAVTSSKGYQAISFNKKSRMNGDIVRIIPFQLSVTYTHMLKSTFSCLTMHTIYQHFRELTKETPRFAELDTTQSIFRYSQLLARNEITTVWPELNITLNVPDSAHVLCPYIKNKYTLITKLAELYQRYLKQKLQDVHNPLKKTRRINNKISTNIIQPAKCSKRLVGIKTNINRLLSSLPYFCNKTIVENLSLFLACNDEDQIQKFLEIFLDALSTISFNLLSTELEGYKLLELYIAQFRSFRTIDSPIRLLEARVFKVGSIVKEFLKTHQLMDYINCFESRLLQEKDPKCEEILRVWLEKSQVKCSLAPDNIDDNKTVPEEKKFGGFFRYKMNQTEDNNAVKIITSMNDIPEVEEIVQGMMEPFSTNMKRSIPHISDVVYLLSQEDRFPNRDDENLLEELKDLFIVQYPSLDKFEIEDLDKFKRTNEYLFSEKGKPDLEEIIYRYCHIKECSNVAMVETIKEKGGSGVDHLLAAEIIGYVFNQKVMGATGTQIKNVFHSKRKILSIENIVEILCDSFIFLEVGITEKVFVHIEHSDPWLVETFHLSPQENHLLHASGNDELQMIQERIESRINSSKPVKVIMMPWLYLDGTLNYRLLDKWLTIVLSYCLESPGCSLINIFEKFYLVKPVELYLLLKILQELKCLEIFTVSHGSEDLWCDTSELQKRPSTILDSFEEMVIHVQPLAATSLGYYLDKEVVEFA